MKNIIAIIPARGGSKSIPQKNIKLLGDKPLIAYPIELAKSIPEIGRVIVSTDSEEIAAVAKHYGAEVPFMRPKELANDEAPTLPVLQHCVTFLEEKEHYKADLILLLYPTCPFLKKERILEAISLFKTNNCSSVIGVKNDWGRYWIYDENENKHKILYPRKRVNRQYYRPLYNETGAIYFSDYETLMIKNKIVDEEKAGFVVMDADEVVDIDTPEDWKEAEKRIQKSFGNNDQNNHINCINNNQNNCSNNKNNSEKEIKSFTIDTPKGKRTIGQGNPAFIIAEMSGNHNQSFGNALKIIDAAAEAGADAVKLQTYTADTLTIDCDKEYFQVKVNDSWKGNTLYSLYKKAYTPWDWQPKLKEYAESKGLLLFSTPFDFTAVDFLEKMNVPLYKVASFETNHLPLLKKIGSAKKPVIISRGLTSIEDLGLAIKTLKEAGAPEVAVLHCVSSYPALPEQMNLNTIPDISRRFNVISGLSDHTLGTTAAITSVALGASIIEKHVTTSRAEGGPDAAFSLEPQELKEMVRKIREAEAALGRVTYEAGNKEAENVLFKQSIFVSKDIKKGELFNEANIRIIRPGHGLAPKNYESVLGKTAAQDLEKGTPLRWGHVEMQGEKNENLLLRFAQEEDCNDIYEWRNDPITIRFSPSGGVEYKNHLQWFAKKIKDQNTQLFIILNQEQQKIGIIRFDKEEEKAEVSINLNPKHRRQGYGKKSLQKALEIYFNNFNIDEITARINPENEASLKLFLGLGFKDTHNRDENKLIIMALSKKDGDKQLKIGLKLWSINHNWFSEAVELFKKKEFDFIELYAVPGTYSPNQLAILKEAGIPVNIHASVEEQGLNLMLENEKNLEIFSEVRKFADFFGSEYIVTHPGIGTDKEVLLRNLKRMDDPRLVIENVPRKSVFRDEPVYGYTYDMLQEILARSGKGFCLDFSHAIKSAKSQGIDAKDFILKLMTLKPKVFHLTGGYLNTEIDEHLNLDEGDFDLQFIRQILKNEPKGVVMETPKSGYGLENDLKNINYFKKIIGRR